MLKKALKTVALGLLLGIVGCKQAADPHPATARPPLLSAEQSQEVLRILEMTDELDKMVRANNTGQPFIDLATKVEAEYLTCEAKLPEPNAAGEAFRLTMKILHEATRRDTKSIFLPSCGFVKRTFRGGNDGRAF